MSEFEHKPVMAKECIELLDPKPGMIFVDGTVGLGGHSELILERILPGGILIGIDKDKNALSMAKKKLRRGFLPVNGNFFNIKEIIESQGIDSVDGIILDLGVSSYQLEDSARGFSYNNEGPLDMRMDTSGELDAKTVVNTYSVQKLTKIIRDYGEERWAARIAARIADYRKQKTIETTTELAEIIKEAIPAPARRTGPHPAKRTFQAIRIEVNGELEGLENAIKEAAMLLKPEGRICVISFHSLEDRAVKRAFGELAKPCRCAPQSPVCTCGRKPALLILTKHPLRPSKTEEENNPRARSAKVRAAQRVAF